LGKMRYLSIPTLLVIIISSGLIFSTLVNNGVADTLILDQKQETWGAHAQIQSNEPIGQSFIPTLSPLAAVDVHIYTINPGVGDDTITCRIRDSTIGGTILGTASQLVADGFEGWVQFIFLQPILVNPGSTYVIELDANLATFAWSYVDGNPYPDGGSIVQGNPPEDEFDRTFRTYSLPYTVPVGGVITSVDKLAMLTPYMALAGLIIAVSTVYVIKRRKD
jgi:hypothetical protein